MARSTYYSADSALYAWEPDIEQWFPKEPKVASDWTDWSTFRSWVTGRINDAIKKLENGTFWNDLNSRGLISDNGEDDELVTKSKIMNSKDLEDLEDIWVLEKIFGYRWEDIGPADESNYAYQKYLNYRSERIAMMGELELFIDEDADSLAEDVEETFRIERG